MHLTRLSEGDETQDAAAAATAAAPASIKINLVPGVKGDSSSSSAPPLGGGLSRATSKFDEKMAGLKMDAIKHMNSKIAERSKDAALVLLNLPTFRDKHTPTYYMEFIEAFTKDLQRVILIRGSAQAVITDFQ